MLLYVRVFQYHQHVTTLEIRANMETALTNLTEPTVLVLTNT